MKEMSRRPSDEIILQEIERLQIEMAREIKSLENDGYIISVLHGSGNDKLLALGVK